MSQQRKQQQFVRFGVAERIEHLVLVISFTLLGLTGLPQKFPDNDISQAFIRFLGGIELTRVIHHIAAAVFLLEAVYHVIIVGYKLYVERKKATMIPTIKDGTDAIQWFRFNLGMTKDHPKMPRYNFMEKAEYWAMLWGFVVMAITGLMLWNPIATTRVLPGEFIPAAKAAHGGEALLAVLAIILWHFYHVHIKHWNWAMIRGTLSRHEMETEHGAELAEIESGNVYVPPTPEEKRSRLNLFIPIAAISSLAMLALVYYFLTFEETAITTLSPAESTARAFVPATATPTAIPAPTATPQPTSDVPAAGAVTISWEGEIQELLRPKCASCHGTLGGFSAKTYPDVMEAVVPGDPDESVIVQTMRRGGHPANLTADELQVLVAWIQAGAPEKAGEGTAGGGQPVASETWSGGIEQLFQTRCGTCHGTLGGYTATNYEDALEGITPGDPDNSRVVELMRAGTHPGKFTEPELTRVINWIRANAPR